MVATSPTRRLPTRVWYVSSVLREALLDWWAGSARQLLDALRDSGPDRMLDLVGDLAVTADSGRRRPPPAPGDRGTHLRRPAHGGRPAAPAHGGGPRRRRRVPVHLLRDDKPVAPPAGHGRLPSRGGQFLAPHPLPRRSTGGPASPTPPLRPTPPSWAPPPSWSWPCTAASRWTPSRATATAASSTSSWTGTRMHRPVDPRRGSRTGSSTRFSRPGDGASPVG